MKGTSEQKSAWRKKWRDANIERVTAYARAYEKKNKDLIRERRSAIRSTPEWKSNRRDYHLKKTYGISLEQFNSIFEDQGRVCAICLTDTPTDKGWCLDHDHSTGRPRGVLCASCNAALGLLEDKVAVLESAIKYLNNYSLLSINEGVPQRS